MMSRSSVELLFIVDPVRKIIRRHNDGDEVPKGWVLCREHEIDRILGDNNSKRDIKVVHNRKKFMGTVYKFSEDDQIPEGLTCETLEEACLHKERLRREELGEKVARIAPTATRELPKTPSTATPQNPLKGCLKKCT